MIPEQFREARRLLGLSQLGLAEILRCDVRTVRRWENGERAIPGPVTLAMELLLERDDI